MGEKLAPMFEKYLSTDRTAITLITQEGEQWCTASVNVPDVHLDKDEVIIKNYSENEGILEALVESGYIEPTNRTAQVGRVTCRICKVIENKDEELLREELLDRLESYHGQDVSWHRKNKSDADTLKDELVELGDEEFINQ